LAAILETEDWMNSRCFSEGTVLAVAIDGSIAQCIVDRNASAQPDEAAMSQAVPVSSKGFQIIDSDHAANLLGSSDR
jgi:hypothetical protein